MERILGAGVTAQVYAALAPDGQRAAVKLLFAHMAADSDVVRRFELEAKVVQCLHHPGIVKILDYDMQCPEGAYIAFEYLEGETLAARAERQPLTVEELVDVSEQIAGALAAAHAAEVVHRDLKPSNVFITTRGEVKILDFGVARVANSLATMGTQFGMAIGTVAYMAPEQALGKHDAIDGRTDVFSLGAMMFRLLSGEPVHPATSVTEALQKTASEPARSLASVCAELPRELVFVVDMSLAFAQEARYESADALQRDLLALKSGAPSSVAGETHHRREQETLVPRDSHPMPPGVNAPTTFAGQDAEVAQARTVMAVATEDAAEGNDEAAEHIGQVVAGRYRIEALLGTGGMGAVYRAEHIHMRKRVALKLLHRAMTTQAEVVTRFEREAVAAARVEHPNVAAAKDFGKLDDGSFYLVLEYVEGKSLRQVLRDGGALSAQRATTIAEQVARALAAAHASGIVHRDLKPENIMLLQRADGSDFVKVLDFGIAKLSRGAAATEPQLTQLGTVFGTPEYMSPEQAMGNHVDAKSDIYSLGIILYELVSGKTPFAGGDMMAVLTSHMTQSPAPLPGHLPPALVSCIVELLDKNPEARPTAATLSERLASSPTQEREAAPSNEPRLLWARFAAWATLAWRRHALPFEQRLYALGLKMPLKLLLVVASASIVSGVLLVVWLTAGGGEPLAAAAEKRGSVAGEADVPSAPEVDLADVADETKAAVERITSLPVYKRSYEDWLTLARGTAQMGRYKESALAYQAVLSLKASMRDDQQLLKDLSTAAYDQDSFALVVNLCATRLKQRGVDLLWLLWQDFRRDTRRTEHSEYLLKKLTVLTRRASRELRTAIELEAFSSCAKLEGVVARAVKYSDQRAVERLQALQKRSGCGPGGDHDCYPCLRGDDRLERALSKAESNPAPEVL